MIFWYVIIGLIYTLINGFVRKLDTEGDWMLVFVWIFMWPVAFLALFINYLVMRKENKI